jgi:hypothetical protein
MDECGMDFPDSEIVDDMCVYATLPNFHEQLYEIARQSMSDGVEAIKLNAEIIKNGCILCIVVEIICIISAVTSIQQQVLGGF